MSQHIIDDPKRIKPQRGIAERSLIIAGSGLILYFFLMVTLVAWSFAGIYFVDTVLSWEHVEATVDILLRLLVVALMSAIVFVGWGEYNFRTYAHLSRRKTPEVVSITEMAELFDMNEEVIALAQASKFMAFHVEDDKHLICDSDQGCMLIRKFGEEAS